MTDKQTPEEKARADAYAAGVASERDHTLRACAERDAARALHESAIRQATNEAIAHARTRRQRDTLAEVLRNTSLYAYEISAGDVIAEIERERGLR